MYIFIGDLHFTVNDKRVLTGDYGENVAVSMTMCNEDLVTNLIRTTLSMANSSFRCKMNIISSKYV